MSDINHDVCKSRSPSQDCPSNLAWNLKQLPSCKHRTDLKPPPQPRTLLLPSVRTRMRQAKVQPQNKAQRETNEQDDEESPPLELSCATRVVHALCELHIRLLRVLDDVLGLLFGGQHGRLLDDDRLGEVLEQLVQLLQRLLDLHDVAVAGADGA